MLQANSKLMRFLVTSKRQQLEYIPFTAFTKLPRAFLKSIGLPSATINNVQNISYNYLFHASFINLGLCVLGEMIYFVRALQDFDNFEFIDIVNVIMCIGFILLCYAKTFTILAQSGRMNHLMTDLQAYYPATLEQQNVYNVGLYLDTANQIMRLYTFIQMFMIWCFNLFPFAETLLGYAADGSWNVDFPYLIWYPFNSYMRWMFEFLYASQFWAAYVSATGILAADLLLCGTVMNICMQFDDLKRRFLELQSPRHSREGIEAIKKYVYKHNDVMRIGRDLDQIFNITILFNFVSSSIIICMLGFLVIFVGRITQILKYTFTLVSCVLQVFIVGWLGDKIISSSIGIGDGVYNSNWFEGDLRYQKCLILVIARSHRAQTLTAYKFSVASQISFASVLSTSWKFLTLLKTVYADRALH